MIPESPQILSPQKIFKQYIFMYLTKNSYNQINLTFALHKKKKQHKIDLIIDLLLKQYLLP
jgi:hypothetical protein